MALTPGINDPNRKNELARIKEIAKGLNGGEILGKEFNMTLDDKTKLAEPGSARSPEEIKAEADAAEAKQKAEAEAEAKAKADADKVKAKGGK